MLYEISTPIIVTIFFLLLLAASEFGFRRGKHSRKMIRAEATAENHSMQGATIGMLSLLLGFTFAMSGAFYSERSSLVERQSSYLENAMMHTDFIENPEVRRESQQYWLEFAQFRLEAGVTPPGKKLREMFPQGHVLRAKIWKLAVENVRDENHNDGATLYAQAAAKAFSISDELAGSKMRRVPEAVIILLLICGCVTAAMLGYGCGLGGTRFTVTQIAQYVIISLILGIIIDLDRPTQGLNNIDHSSLMAIIESMKAPPTAVTAP